MSKSNDVDSITALRNLIIRVTEHVHEVINSESPDNRQIVELVQVITELSNSYASLIRLELDTYIFNYKTVKYNNKVIKRNGQ